jgi:hypothetical protein
VDVFDGYPLKRRAIQIRERICGGLALGFLAACGPHAHKPLRPANLPDALAPTDSGALLARRLAPVLYLQRDETFPLERVVAVLHSVRRVIAYRLLWRDDVHGSWIPFTVPTDEEVLWVGHDSTYAPTDVWTCWHGQILRTAWPRSQVAIDVQWGKHGSLPRSLPPCRYSPASTRTSVAGPRQKSSGGNCPAGAFNCVVPVSADLFTDEPRRSW